MKISINDARQLVKTILLKAGFDGPNAHAVMQTIVASEIDGCTAHGLWRTLGCVRTLHNGKVVADARPQVDNLAPGLVRVDAKGDFPFWRLKPGGLIWSIKPKPRALPPCRSTTASIFRHYGLKLNA